MRSAAVLLCLSLSACGGAPHASTEHAPDPAPSSTDAGEAASTDPTHPPRILIGVGIDILERITFAPGDVTFSDDAIAVIDLLASTLVSNAGIQLVAVRGTCMSSEPPMLARARALAVLELLVVRGVARERLVAEEMSRDPDAVPTAAAAPEVWFSVRRADEPAFVPSR